MAEAVPLATILGFYLLSGLVLPLGQNVPIGDSSHWAWSARQLIEHGTLRLSDWQAMSLIGQLFLAAPVGFVFSAEPRVLILFTYFLSAATACLFYLLVRRLGFDRSVSLVAVGALVTNPIWLAQSVTFDTEIYFLFPCILGLLSLACWEKSGRPWQIWLACGAFAYAVLIRQHAMIFAVAGLVHRASFPRERRSPLLPWVLPFLALAGFYLWLNAVHGVPKEFASRQELLIEHLTDPLGILWPLAADLIAGTHYLGIFLLALCPLFFAGRRRGEPIQPAHFATVPYVIVAILVLIGTLALGLGPGHPLRGQSLMPYLPNIVNLGDFSQNVPAGAVPAWVRPEPVRFAITAISGLGAVLLLSRLILAWRSRITNAYESRVPSKPFARLLILAALTLLGFSALTGAASFDRYFLVPLVLVIPLALPRSALSRSSLTLAAVLIVVWAGISLYFVDQRVRNRSCSYVAAQGLVAQGIEPRKIGGGFEFNSYYTYEYYSAKFGAGSSRAWPPWWIPEATYLISRWPKDNEGYRLTDVHRCPNLPGLMPIRAYIYTIR